MKITRGRCGAGVVLSVTIMLGLAGCGSGASGTSAGATSAGSGSPAPATPSAAASSSAAEDAGGTSGDYCAVVKENVAYLTGGEIAKLVTSGKPADWQAYLDTTAKANEKLVDASPAEVRPVVEQLKKDSEVLAVALEKADYDMAKMGASELLASINSPEHLAAVDTFVTFTKSECDIDLLKLS